MWLAEIDLGPAYRTQASGQRIENKSKWAKDRRDGKPSKREMGATVLSPRKKHCLTITDLNLNLAGSQEGIEELRDSFQNIVDILESQVAASPEWGE